MATGQVQEIRPTPPPIVDGNSGEPVDMKDALALDELVKQYFTRIRFSWSEIGRVASEISVHDLWKVFPVEAGEEPFTGFDDYLLRRGQKGRTTIYRARQLYDGLVKLGDKMHTISQANAIWLLRCVTRLGESKGLSERFVSSASLMTEKEFASFCKDNLPGAAAEETKKDRSWRLDESLAKVVDKAVKVAMWEEETDDEKVGIERIVTYYLESKCEKEGFHNLSNQMAYAKAHGRKTKKGSARLKQAQQAVAKRDPDMLPGPPKKRGRPKGSKNKAKAEQG